jgi:hypothetical protein
MRDKSSKALVSKHQYYAIVHGNICCVSLAAKRNACHLTASCHAPDGKRWNAILPVKES